MSIRGHFENGVIVLDEPAALEEGAAVLIEPFAAPAKPPSDISLEGRPILNGGQLLEFSGIMEGYPPDMARNHDHYLHGRPKK